MLLKLFTVGILILSVRFLLTHAYFLLKNFRGWLGSSNLPHKMSLGRALTPFILPAYCLLGIYVSGKYRLGLGGFGLIFFGVPLGVLLVIKGFVWLGLGCLAVADAVEGFLRARWKRCSHGIRRGESGRCQSCRADAERREEGRLAEQNAYQAELRRRNAIAERANLLRASELHSIREKWLSRSEVYSEMDSRQFENAIAELFRALGYTVTQTPYSNDRGKDGIALKDGKKYLIECKRYNASNTIGRRDLQIFVAAMKEENAHGGFYINTGRFARTAEDYAAQNQIELYDRERLPGLVGRAYTRMDDLTVSAMCLECGDVKQLSVASVTGTCGNGHQIRNDLTAEILRRLSFAPESVCDRCGSEMRLEENRYGRFWQCSRFPDCRARKRAGRSDRWGRRA